LSLFDIEHDSKLHSQKTLQLGSFLIYVGA